MQISNRISVIVTLLPLALTQMPVTVGESEPTTAPERAGIAVNPEPTLPQDDLADPQIVAIEPTASGEIGINPVDLPSASHASIGVDTQYPTREGDTTKWIGVDKWSTGSATVGAGQPDATEHAIPKGFQVAVGEDGSIEIGLSQWVHDRFEAIAENLPACPAKRRRQAVSACTRRRTYQFAEEIARDSELMEQVEGLSSELAEAVGGEGYAAKIIQGDQTLVFGDADLVRVALEGLGARGYPGSKPKQGDDSEEEEGCPKKDEIQAPCPAEECEGKEDEDISKCTVGEYKGCPCLWPGKHYSQPFYEEWEIIEGIFNSTSTQLSVECDPQGDATELPESLFRGGIYDKFCDEVEKNRDIAVAWIVDHEGNKIPNKARRSDRDTQWLPRPLGRRSPPVDSDVYKEYTIELEWEPTKDGGACSESCNDALLGVSNSQCGNSGAHQNTMAGVSKYNVLCGEYTVTVKALANMPPPAYRTDPAPSRPTPTQGCWDLNELGDHGPVREDQVRAGAKIFCEGDKTLSRENSWHSTEFAPDNRWGNEPLGHLDSWLTYSATMDMDECDRNRKIKLLDTEGPTSCENLLVNNFKNCDNGGTGGYIKDGCVTYMFWPYRGPTEGEVGSPDKKITGFG